MSELPTLASDQLMVHQMKEWGEIFTDWETQNRYEILTPDGQRALIAGENSTGAFAFLTRSFLKNRRPFTIELKDLSGGLALRVVRPWTWFFSRIEVYDAGGTLLGQVRQRFAFFSKRFSIEDPRGSELGIITGPLFRPWTFEVESAGSTGQISKKFGGVLKEMFSDADNFGIQFASAMDSHVRSLVLGATFLIDFLYFEDTD